MPTPQEIRATVHAYIDMMCKSDIEGILGFNADGKITSMRAYWNPAELRGER